MLFTWCFKICENFHNGLEAKQKEILKILPLAVQSNGKQQKEGAFHFLSPIPSCINLKATKSTNNQPVQMFPSNGMCHAMYTLLRL